MIFSLVSSADTQEAAENVSNTIRVSSNYFRDEYRCGAPYLLLDDDAVVVHTVPRRRILLRLFRVIRIVFCR
jgi:hypothetical protein